MSMYWFNAGSVDLRPRVSDYVDTFNTTTSTANLAIQLPSGSVGDLLLVAVVWQSWNPPAAPAGWTVAANGAVAATNRPELIIYQRIRDGSEAATFAFGNLTTVSSIAARALNITNAGLVSNNSNIVSTVSGPSSAVVPQIGNTVPDSLMMRFVGARQTSASPTLTLAWSAGWEGMPEVRSATSMWSTLGAATKSLPSVGTEPDLTVPGTTSFTHSSISLQVPPKLATSTLGAVMKRAKLAAQQEIPMNTPTGLVGWASEGAPNNGTVSSGGLVVVGDGKALVEGRVSRNWWGGAQVIEVTLNGYTFSTYTGGGTDQSITPVTVDLRDGQVLGYRITNSANPGGDLQYNTNTYIQYTPVA